MISKEYVAQVIDQKSIIRYVSVGKDRLAINKWYVDHVNKGTFKDLKLSVTTRYLWNDKPMRVSKRDVVWALNGALFIYLIWRISSL